MLKFASEWKDFFWIIFTLVATLTSFLTYVRVRKSFYQPLYTKVMDAQIDVYMKILKLLGDSHTEFLFNCDIENLIRYNLIAHCAAFGYFEGDKFIEKLLNNYLLENRDILSEADRWNSEDEKKLSQIEELNLIGSDEVGDGSLEYDNNESDVMEEKELQPGIYHVTNIRGLFLHTMAFNEVFCNFNECMKNPFLPKKLKKDLENLYNNLLDILLGKVTEIIRTQEERILTAEAGQEVKINFYKLVNNVMENHKMIEKNYEQVKKEIRKLLKVDAHW